MLRSAGGEDSPCQVVCGAWCGRIHENRDARFSSLDRLTGLLGLPENIAISFGVRRPAGSLQHSLFENSWRRFAANEPRFRAAAVRKLDERVPIAAPQKRGIDDNVATGSENRCGQISQSLVGLLIALFRVESCPYGGP